MSVEQRGPAVCAASDNTESRGEMIKAPISLRDLRRRIYRKAKAEPAWRFWGLYVHVCKLETLRKAYRLARENDGAPGIDGATFEAIEAAGLETCSNSSGLNCLGTPTCPRGYGEWRFPSAEARASACCRFLLSGTVWSKARSSLSLSPSSRPTSNRGRMATGPNGRRMRRWNGSHRRLCTARHGFLTSTCVPFSIRSGITSYSRKSRGE